jgi:dipeptidyl aminopeptidase/acylaminoacyl peptidase
MADDSNPTPSISEPSLTDQNPGEAPPRRKVYQPTLFPERRRRRASPWVVIPSLLIVLGGILWGVVAFSHHVRFVPTAGEIVYTSDAGSPGKPHIWITHADGTGARQLTSGPAADITPQFAPGGSQIAFLSDRDDRVYQIFVMDGDGQDLVQVTHNSGAKSQVSWSPGNPDLLGYTDGGALYEMPFGGEGGGAGRLLPPPPNVHQAQDTTNPLAQSATITVPSYAWSPAKNAGLAAVEDTGTFQALAVMPTLAAAPKDMRTTPQGTQPLIAASQLSLGWNNDGSLLAVAVLNIQGAPQPTSGLLLFESNGDPAPGKPPLLLGSATQGPQNPVFSPDGTQILFEAWNQPNLADRKRLGLALVPTDGSAPPHFVFRGNASDAQFSPDGSTIFFLTARPDGGHDLCRVGTDGSGFTRLTSGSGDVTDLSVSPQSAAH